MLIVLLQFSCGNPLIVEKYANGNPQFEYYQNEKGEKHGHYISYFENGNKRSEGEYNNGIQINKWTYWHESGNLLSEGVLDINGKEEGEWYFYFPNGILQQQEFWKGGVKEGRFVEYYEQGSVKRTGNVRNGFLDGRDSNYFESGILESSRNWENGKVHGFSNEYLASGKLVLSEMRDDDGPFGFICIHDTITGDTLYKHFVIFGRLSDTAKVYKNNQPFKDTIIDID